MRVPFYEVVNGFLIISAQYLLKIIFADMAVPFQVLNQQVDLFFCVYDLFGSAAKFDRCASAEDFVKGEFAVQNI
jgi:hypothetical protein